MMPASVVAAARMRSAKIVNEIIKRNQIEMARYISAPRTGHTYYTVLRVANSGAFIDCYTGRLLYQNEHFGPAFQYYVKKWLQQGDYEKGWIGSDERHVLACIQDIRPEMVSCHLLMTSAIPIFYFQVSQNKLMGLGRPGPFTFLIRENENAEKLVIELDNVIEYVYSKSRKQLAQELGRTKWYQWWFTLKHIMREELAYRLGMEAYQNVYKFIKPHT